MLSTKLQAAQTRIRAQWYPHFTWQLNDSAPWSPLSRPLSEATVALLSTCGLYRYDQQLPFDAWNPLGDPAFREIHIDTPVERLRIAHSHYEQEHVETDINVVLPILHFQQLAAQGVIGRLYPWTYSFMGYLPEPASLITDTAPQVARRLAADGVHAAFLTPCWPICQQSVGLIARALEEHGIATICVAMNHDIIAAVKAPRALFVHFPYGAPLGPAGDRDVQRAVIRNALDVLVSATAPGTIVESDVDWPDWTGWAESSSTDTDTQEDSSMRISIEFCMSWNYTPRAASLAEALFTTFKPLVGRSHPIETVTLIPSGNGRFEVVLNDELIYSKAATGKHTTNEFIVSEVRKRLK